jgi:hypothetical protein
MVFSLAQQWFGILYFVGYYWDCSIVILVIGYHIQPLANVTVETIVIGKVGKLVLSRTSCFSLFTVLIRTFGRLTHGRFL